jgi:hypothetical protein
MTVIGSNMDGLHSTASSHEPSLSWWERFNTRLNTLLDNFVSFMTSILCRASRGYLCPPDMTSVMYPDDPGDAQSTKASIRRCCDESVSKQ